MIRKISTFLTLFVALFAMGFSAQAAKYNVATTAGNTWTATSFSINRGDTVVFKWTPNSGNHNTTNGIIPSGAAAWSSLLDASHLEFMYVPTKEGTYIYTCTLHGAMQGAFLVNPALSVGGNLFTEAGITISPNPATSFITIKSGVANPTITLTNIIGKNIGTFSGTETTEGTTINVASVPSGTYFISVANKEMVITRRIVIAH